MPFPLDHYIEASYVDYKERLEEKKPRSWLKSVSAFANTEGGHLIFGVKNEPREVVGLENPQAVVSRLTELIKVRIDPSDSGTGQYGKCVASGAESAETSTVLHGMSTDTPECRAKE